MPALPVDAPWRPRPGRRPTAAATCAALAALAAAACSAPPPPPPDPTIDAPRAAGILEAGTRLQSPARIVFTWSISDRDLRMSGRGVARVEPPYRARLDLFLDNGEQVVAAALVGDDLRLPPGAPQGIIPPPEMLWGALGVFHPGPAALLGADAPESGRIRLRYGYDDGSRVHFIVAGDRIYRVERQVDGRTVQRVTVQPATASDERYPDEAVYRDVGAFRELTITRESVDHVEAYPPDIWNVG